MRNQRLALAMALGISLSLVSMRAQAQRGGARGGAAVGARGGAAVGARGGAAVGARGGAAAGAYGGGARVQSGGAVLGPGGSAAAGGAQRGSYTTNRGTTINYAGAGGAVKGPAGGAAAKGAGGVQVTTPGGQSVAKVGRAGAAVGPGGAAVAGRSSVGVASGPRGTAVGASRGGAALGPGGAVAGGSRVGVAAGAGGVVAGGVRAGAAVGPYGAAAYTARGGVARVGGTHFVTASTLQARGAYVRRGFVHYNAFTPTWYASHRTAWRAAGWTAANFWAAATWATIAATCRFPVQPVIYDYGTTIVYQGDQVLYNGEVLATAADYSQQAAQIAAQGTEATPADDEWISLGVFGMVQGDSKDANNIFQLAIDKAGLIRGNYYDALSDTTLPVTGAVDQKTQRAAWTVGDRKDTVYETGVANLSQPETSMLIHFGKDRTQQWTLVRLEKPAE